MYQLMAFLQNLPIKKVRRHHLIFYHHHFFSLWHLLVFLLLTTALTGWVRAQEQLETMVVTATKREDPALKIPISLTVFSSEDIDDLSFLDSNDIAQQTLNLQWRSQFGTSSPNIFIRGIGNNSFHSNAIGPVAIYHDGVYLGSNIVHGFPLFDLDRVEVLRGPQGTLFGKNTTAGLVHYISRKPEIDSEIIDIIKIGNDHLSPANTNLLKCSLHLSESKPQQFY